MSTLSRMRARAPVFPSLLGTSLLLSAVSACHPVEEPEEPRLAKSVYALSEDDFEYHGIYAVAADGMRLLDEPAITRGRTDTGFLVNRGDPVLIKAEGSLYPDFPSIIYPFEKEVGPEGSAYVPTSPSNGFVLTDVPGFSLVGRVGGQGFFAGREALVLAPESGPLEVLVNDMPPSPHPRPGEFITHVYSGVKVDLATTPLLADNTRVSPTYTFSFTPGSSWVHTGFHVERGQKIFLQLGDMPGAPLVRLQGRVGASFINLLGMGQHSGVFLAPSTGGLEVRLLPRYRDQPPPSGEWSLFLEGGIIPARGLVGTELETYTQQWQGSLSPPGQWVSTGIQLERGSPIVVTASGSVQQHRNLPYPDRTIGPDGNDDWLEGYSVAPLYKAYALIGRVGNETFLLGSRRIMLSPATGTLEVAINMTTGDVCAQCIPDCYSSSCAGCERRCSFTGAFDVSVAAP